jgi:hypothetical protein
MPVANPAADQAALSNVSIAAMLGLIGAILSVVGIFASPASSLVGVTTTPTGTTVSLPLGALYFVAALAVGGLAFGLIELWFYRRSFVALRPIDNRFSTPASLVLAAMIGIILAVLGAIGIFVLLYQAVVCAAGNPLTSSCINVTGILGLAGLLVVALIVALVGYIGLLIGIWRLGTRYQEGLFKAGAILLIFPVLNLVGLILILVAARSARSKVASGRPGMATG